MTPVISLRSASFGYADRKVVSGVSLDIRAGETVALVGANGSGKSTLVKGLLGINDHLGGQVELFGTPLGSFHKRYLLGYVPQRHTLSASVAATVTEIVSTGRLPHQGLLVRSSRHDRQVVADALEVVGLSDFARADVATLSGGQQRRCLIARALAAQPEVLIMDEPTAGVDIANQHLLVGVLRRLVDGGATLLIVTHDVDPLRPVLQRRVTMRGGQIVADDSLLTAGSDDSLSPASALERAQPEHDGHHDEDADHQPGVPLAPAYPSETMPRA